MVIYWPTSGFKVRTFKLCLFVKWNFNFYVRSCPLRECEVPPTSLTKDLRCLHIATASASNRPSVFCLRSLNSECFHISDYPFIFGIRVYSSSRVSAMFMRSSTFLSGNFGTFRCVFRKWSSTSARTSVKPVYRYKPPALVGILCTRDVWWLAVSHHRRFEQYTVHTQRFDRQLVSWCVSPVNR